MKDEDMTDFNVLAWNPTLQTLVVLPTRGAPMTEDVYEGSQEIEVEKNFFGKFEPLLGKVSPRLQRYLKGVSREKSFEVSPDGTRVRITWRHLERTSQWGGDIEVRESPDGYRGASTLAGHRVSREEWVVDYVSEWIPVVER